MPDTLPLRQIVLYKHGVGYFTRQGVVAGRVVELPFRSNEVDDALKSLTAVTLDGGQVTSIAYQTPENKRERFAEIPLSLGDEHSLFDLLRDLRGTLITVKLRTGETLQGRVVGIEKHPQGKEHGATLVLLTGTASVEQIPTEELRQLLIDDARMAGDLDSFLDTSKSEEARRSVRIELTEPGRKVQVSYTVPSPVWRVSYRLVGTSGEDEERSCLLQGWGIFDNRLDENLSDVEVILVAGQPVSFRYDLTSSVIPERRFVRDESRVAAGPVVFDTPAEIRAPPPPPTAAAAPRMALARRAVLESTPLAAERLEEQLDSSTRQAWEARDLAELFEYRVGGVSVKRGESAMVPVAQHRGGYRRELIYSGSKQPSHPVASLRLSNETGLTLERGPVTVVEDGQYRGEAILPFTKPGSEIVLAFAVELGIRVLEEVKESSVMTGLELSGSYLQFQEHMAGRTTYKLINNTEQDQVVTVEQAKWREAELTDTREPDEETGEHRRWRISCPAKAETVFQVTERLLVQRRETILDQTLDALSRYLEHRFLDGRTRRELEKILHLRQTIHDIDRQVEKLRAEQRHLGERQDRLRMNLEIAASNEQEQQIRRRSADEFSRTQDRDAEIERELVELKQRREQAEAELQTELAKL